MTKYKSHPPGTFSWVELATTDPTAAKKFYGALLGWAFDDRPIGPGMVYTMCKLAGDDAAALYGMGEEMKGVPSHWSSYITVENVDASVRRAAGLGGTVVKEPFDVMDAGRMAVLKDPTGAAFCLWQPKNHVGAGVKLVPGAMCWNELYTTDVERAGRFYAEAIGWNRKSVDMGKLGTYTLFSRPGDDVNHIGGMMAMPPTMKGVPPHWLVYLAVADVDQSTKRVGELGGKVLMPPMDISDVGRFSVAQDPTGAAFALFKSVR